LLKTSFFVSFLSPSSSLRILVLWTKSSQVKQKLWHSDATGRCANVAPAQTFFQLGCFLRAGKYQALARESGGVTQSCDPSGAEEREPSAATPTPSQSESAVPTWLSVPVADACARCLCGLFSEMWTVAACFRLVNHKSGFLIPKRSFQPPTWNPLPSSYGHLSFLDYRRLISC